MKKFKTLNIPLRDRLGVMTNAERIEIYKRKRCIKLYRPTLRFPIQTF